MDKSNKFFRARSWRSSGSITIGDLQRIPRLSFGFDQQRGERHQACGHRPLCSARRSRGENSKQFPVYPAFIPEDTAKLILSQIVGFDPKKQPVAFDDEFIQQNMDRIKGDRLRKLDGGPKNSRTSNRPGLSEKTNKMESKTYWIIGVISLLLAAFTVVLLRRLQKNRSKRA